MTDSINEASSDVELIGDIDSKASSPLPGSDDSEPIVTRKELWSYYSKSCAYTQRSNSHMHIDSQCTITVIMSVA